MNSALDGNIELGDLVCCEDENTLVVLKYSEEYCETLAIGVALGERVQHNLAYQILERSCPLSSQPLSVDF